MRLLSFSACLLFSLPLFAQIESAALAASEDANCGKAMPLLEAAHAQSPNDAAVAASLLSCYVLMDRVDAAAGLDSALTAIADSAAVFTARGEFAFHMGDMPSANKLFRSALHLQPDFPRADLGLARLLRAASFYRSARLLILKAHEVDPADALITREFLRYVVQPRRRELLGPFAASHPWLYLHFREHLDTADAIHTAAGEKMLYEADGPAQETTLRFVLLTDGPNRTRGVGLELRLNNGHAVHVLFDTGASGILLRQSVIDKAGLSHLGGDQVSGVGDQGARNSFAAMADTCQVAALHFKNCLVEAIEGKKAIGGDQDGLIGADFFDDYVITIDFQRNELHLKPLPPRPASAQGYDRLVPPGEENFTPVFRFGHMLLVSTVVNRKSTGLFLLDTGSNVSNIDFTFARLSTKLSGSDLFTVQGVSGKVNRVYEAHKGELQFGHFRQNNIGLLAFDLNHLPDPYSVRMSGILGLPVLAMFRLTIDYRNGLVNFDYILR